MPSVNDTNVLPNQRGLFYGGRWHDAVGGGRIQVASPATGQDLGTVADGGAADIDAAVTAAAKAFPEWRDLAVSERSKLVRKAAGILREHAAELAHLEALDSGNPYKAMLVDVELSVD